MKRPKPKYSFEIDCSDRECDRAEPRWSNFGYLVAEGDTLEELLQSASIDWMDQDGGCLGDGPADSEWMQDLIALKYWSENGCVPNVTRNETDSDFLARMSRMPSPDAISPSERADAVYDAWRDEQTEDGDM